MDLDEIFLPHKDSYVGRYSAWRRSFNQKLNWKTYGAIYKMGIHRYYRGVGAGLRAQRTRILSRIKAISNNKDGFIASLRGEGLVELLSDFNFIVETITTDPDLLDIDHNDVIESVDYVLYADFLQKAFFTFEQNVTKGLLPPDEVVEALLTLVSLELQELYCTKSNDNFDTNPEVSLLDIVSILFPSKL